MRKLEMQAASMHAADNGVVTGAAACSVTSEGQKEEAGILPECRQLVQQAIKAIMLKHACGHQG